ncbi:hypothetical protein MGU_10211 [Metarhizium guizhouense ARSEF 977]|uniref:Uncharacterized protein n=1 Tax=Metarhizium guizhouense (strain ARSEF 977) TaxID=1276136 RepID=A0A0B4GRS2_METGA|nr:hypothetical protein MGU_10211 [Metarhizium guizhouense ARSEF 977]
MLDLLESPTVEAFAKKDEQEQMKILNRLLIHEESIEIFSFDSVDVKEAFEAVRAMLLLRDNLGDSKIEQQLLQKARHIFYEENEFVFVSYEIFRFLDDVLGEWTHAAPVETLVRNVVIVVQSEWSGWMEGDLQQALRFTNPAHLEVVIAAQGTLDGQG